MPTLCPCILGDLRSRCWQHSIDLGKNTALDDGIGFLFPEWDATYLDYNGNHDSRHGFKATYQVPENKAFWSITVYGKDGFMKNDDNIVNSSNVGVESRTNRRAAKSDESMSARRPPVPPSADVRRDLVCRVPAKSRRSFIRSCSRPGKSSQCHESSMSIWCAYNRRNTFFWYSSPARPNMSSKPTTATTRSPYA